MRFFAFLVIEFKCAPAPEIVFRHTHVKLGGSVGAICWRICWLLAKTKTRISTIVESNEESPNGDASKVLG